MTDSSTPCCTFQFILELAISQEFLLLVEHGIYKPLWILEMPFETELAVAPILLSNTFIQH